MLIQVTLNLGAICVGRRQTGKTRMTFDVQTDPGSTTKDDIKKKTSNMDMLVRIHCFVEHMNNHEKICMLDNFFYTSDGLFGPGREKKMKAVFDTLM